jgi:hypothetical protein
MQHRDEQDICRQMQKSKTVFPSFAKPVLSVVEGLAKGRGGW